MNASHDQWKAKQVAEYKMREVRAALAAAHQAEVAGEIELADACGAVAIVKMEVAVRLNQREETK